MPTENGPVLQMPVGDRVLRFVRASSGHLRRLGEDERGVRAIVGAHLAHLDFTQIEMRYADMAKSQR
jgi:hypothetical protein